MSQPTNMPAQDGGAAPRSQPESLRDTFQRIRATTTGLTSTLTPEDTVVQTMPDVSPTKWHLAHTSWFFEHFILKRQAPTYRQFDSHFGYLFNSYYFTVGQMHQRARRGMLSRPSLDEIMAYRAHVDHAMDQLLSNNPRDEGLKELVTLGLNHEQQHQELILTDIKHVFSSNPLKPALRVAPELPLITTQPYAVAPLSFIEYAGGITEAGHQGNGFSFDNETPRHKVLLQPFELADRPVTNQEYREFVDAGGYQNCEHWLSDGWTTVQQNDWQHPLYWSDDLQQEFSLSGMRDLEAEAPVSHLSLYEADAYARWAGARLPTEFEWEAAASDLEIDGNLQHTGLLHPAPGRNEPGLKQMFGDVWEWTTSSYSAYAGFKPLNGSLGEYNGKFMCGQAVLRGGSCATPVDHIRATYRNFFYPHQRWQFSGLRLARNR